MTFFKCLIGICLLLLISGCTNEDTFEEFFNKSMNNVKHAEIVQVDENDQGTIVIYSFMDDGLKKYSIGMAAKEEEWKWLGNGLIDFDQAWQGLNEDRFTMYYGVILRNVEREILVEDHVAKQIPLDSIHEVWYHVDFLSNSQNVEIHSLNENNEKEIMKEKVKE